jgi:protein XagA
MGETGLTKRGKAVRILVQAFVLVICLISSTEALAGAWPKAKGEAELIVKIDKASADKAFDASGEVAVDLKTWEDKTVSVYIDYGLTDKLSAFAKTNLQDIKTDVETFSGLGSVEIGLKTNLYKTNDTVIALSASLEGLGKGRRDSFGEVGAQGTDFEVRAYIGRNLKVKSIPAFAEVQLAKRTRSHDQADQWRVDLSLGLKPNDRWMILSQFYAGQTDMKRGFQAKWVNSEVSLIRNLGQDKQWAIQLSARQTLFGQNVPEVKALGLSLWRRF